MDDGSKSNVSHLAEPPETITVKSAAQTERRELACSFCQRSLPEVGCLLGSTVARICTNCLRHLSALADAQHESGQMSSIEARSGANKR